MEIETTITQPVQSVRLPVLCSAMAISMFMATAIGTWVGTAAPDIPAIVTEALHPASEKVLLASTMDAEDLKRMVAEREELLTRSVTVTFTDENDAEIKKWTLQLADHPELVAFQRGDDDLGHAAVTTERVRQYLISYPVDGIKAATSCEVTKEWKDPQGVLRAETGCIAEGGYMVDNSRFAETVKTALERAETGALVQLQSEPALIMGLAESGTIVGRLELLATGKSNFQGSGDNRKANVRKALNEHVNNVVVPEGATFSFNATLGKSVDVSAGWHMALTIFNGDQLLMAPGGGICQASSTVYRAVLNAGFPLLQHKNHSLFVHYYEAYGVGLDATVFPGQQNLTFVNDSPGPLLIQSYNRGDDAFVQIFGINDHRTVTMAGPYFSKNAPEVLADAGLKLRINEIAWKRRVTMPSGEQKDEIYLSRYKLLPRTLAIENPVTVTQSRGDHAPLAAGRTIAAE